MARGRIRGRKVSLAEILEYVSTNIGRLEMLKILIPEWSKAEAQDAVTEILDSLKQLRKTVKTRERFPTI